MNDEPRDPHASPPAKLPPLAEPPSATPPLDSTPANPLTPEEQMALFEQELKETDWGHQPC